MRFERDLSEPVDDENEINDHPDEEGEKEVPMYPCSWIAQTPGMKK